MRRFRQFGDVIAGGVGLAMLAAVAGLAVQLALARPAPGRQGFTTTHGFTPTPVNRGLKGDRLPVIPGARGENPGREPPLPKGCEHNFSSVRNAYANEVAGRCLAAGEPPPFRSRAPGTG